MRALAEFIMKGRFQAVAVSGLGIGTLMFAWVGAAAAALVMLRKGLAEGAYVVFWALLPAIAVAYVGNDIGPLTMLLGTAVSAQVLREQRSWAAAILAAVGMGLLTALLLLHFGSAYLQSLLALVQPIMDDLRSQTQGQLPTLGEGDVAAAIGGSTMLWSVLAVMLARWWQAMLYNPGGFREEMWALRLPSVASLILVVLLLLLRAAGEDYRFWGVICMLPFVIAGLALVHGVIGKRQMGRVWLVGFYVALALLTPLWALLVLVAILDSWIDFRKRLSPPSGAE
ncbi:hypothetical protein GCM10027567_08620 [Spongiibacter taiwanensis]